MSRPTNKAPSPDTIAHLEQALSALTARDDLVMAGAHARPGNGSAGRPIAVEANMFSVRQTGRPVTIQHYDVDIVPVVKVANQKMPKPLAGKIWAQCSLDNMTGPDKNAFHGAVYDLQKNIFTCDTFTLEANGKKEFIVELPESDGKVDDKRRFKVIIKHAQVIDLNSVIRFCQGSKQSTQESEIVLTAITAVNVLLRDHPMKNFTPMGARGRFFGVDGAIPISGGGLVGKGFMQSFRPTNSGLPAIQLDTAFTAFFKSGSLLELIPQVLGMGGAGGGGGGRGFGRGDGRGRGGGRGGPPTPHGGIQRINELTSFQIKTLKKLFYGAKFTLPYKKSSRVFTIKGISTQSACDITFTQNGQNGEPDKNIGIVQYFKMQFNIVLEKPRLPCIIYGKNFMAPIELVMMNDFNSIPFAALSSDQAADMIRVAAQKPMDRSMAIKDWRQKLIYNELPKLKAWGLEVSPTMMQLTARVLQPPTIMYAKNNSIKTQFGAWNLQRVSFTNTAKSAALNHWAVLSFSDRTRDRREAGPIISGLVHHWRSYGVDVKNGNPEFVFQPPGVGPGFDGVITGLRKACQQIVAKSSDKTVIPQLIVVILPKKDTAMYATIKHAATMRLKLPVVTQCLLGSKLDVAGRGFQQYCGNVAMKIQAKLGGTTHEIPMPETVDRTTMLIGADVTHPPGRGGVLEPSIAVTVAAVDSTNVKFQEQIRLQEGRTEIIHDLCTMAKQHMETFKKRTGAWPQKILFFRDGVSDGQYSQVCKQEIEAIRRASHDLSEKYKPKVTFVICAKRHNMRFFATKVQETDRSGNLPAGTVVDTRVTHPFAFDFYLQAHAGLQGTARPTHYVVLRDDNNFTADKMQNLCNHLSYTYARATRAVSMIPVAYYADIIATQARNFIYTDDESTDNRSVLDSGNRGTRSFQPLQLSARIEGSPFHQVSWYM